MKLITELTEEVNYITEAKEDGTKRHFIEGVFLMGEIKNRNGRIYPIEVLKNAVDTYKETHIDTKRALGELAHPNGPQINLDRVSHIITQLVQDGNNFNGKALITETPMGAIVKGLLISGVSLGVSSRCLGSLKEDRNGSGCMIVQPDLKISTAADIVADPSAPNAYVKGIMENAEWVYDVSTDTWYQEKLHEAKKRMRKMTMDEIERNKLGIFESFVSKLSSKKTFL
jgi:hypothetical protein